MTDPRTDKTDGLDDEALEALRAAGRRSPVDPSRRDAVKAAVRPAWQRSVERRRFARPRQRRRRVLRWALPVAAVLALVVLSRWRTESPPPMTAATTTATTTALATVEGVLGSGAQVVQTEAPRPLTVGEPLGLGATIDSGDGGLALRLADGSALRLASATRIRLLASGRVELVEGGVYVDTHPEGPPPADAAPPVGAVAIETRWGTATDVGTQFEVRLDAERLRIRVREGRVDLARGADHLEISAGHQLAVDASGETAWSDVTSHGAPWAWVVDLAPPFRLEGRTVADFLAWVARETGTTLRWQAPELASTVGASTAHGSLEGLDPITALEVVPPASGLRAELVAGELRVWAADAP